MGNDLQQDPQQQQQQHADPAKQPRQIDADAEHKPDVARKTSNAGLQREAAGAAKKTAGEAHSESSVASLGSAEAAMQFLAMKMVNSMPHFEQLAGTDPHAADERGPYQAADKITELYNSLVSNVGLVHSLMVTVVWDDALLLKLIPYVAQLEGAFNHLSVPLIKAENFVHALYEDERKRSGAETDAPVEKSGMQKALELQARIQELGSVIGQAKSIHNDAYRVDDSGNVLPKGTPEELGKAMVQSQIIASQVAIESVKDGNENDAVRVAIALDELDAQRGEQGVKLEAKDRAELKKMQADIHALLKEKPELAKLHDADQKIARILSAK